MASSKESSASPPGDSGTPMDPHELQDERSQTDGSSPKACNLLSADEIDEQIRAYFAQDLA